MTGSAETASEGDLDRRFTEMVEAHQAMVYRYARFLVRDPAQADEITQDAFVTAFTKLRGGGLQGEMDAWLRGVVRNLVMRSRAKRKVRVLFCDEEGLEMAERMWAQERTARPASAASDPRLAALRACVETLDAEERRLLKLRFEEGRAREGIAQALRLSVEGVKTRLRRLRGKLMECTRRRLAADEGRG